MKTWWKVLAAALGVVIVAVICAWFLVKSVLLPETVRATIIPRLEEIVKQPISYSQMDVGLGGTITLKEITVGDGEPRGQGILVKARDMLLHCRILPLLSKTIIIEQITLREPSFRLVRNESGQFNVWSSPGPDREGEKPDAGDSARAEPEPALSLNIRSLAFQDGTLTFTDHFKRAQQPLETAVKDINGRFSDLSPVSPFSLDMTAEVVSSSPSVLRVKALIDPVRKAVTSDVKLSPFDITLFAPYVPPLPFAISKGCCSLDLTLAVNRALDISSRGVVRLTNAVIVPHEATGGALSSMLAEMISSSEISLDHDLTYRPADDLLIMEKCTAALRKMSLTFKGKIENCRTEPRCDITADADGLAAADLLNALPRDLLPAVKNISSSGTASAHLSVKGSLQKPDELAVGGSLLMDKLVVQSDAPPRWKLQVDGSATLTNGDVQIQPLTAKTGNSTLNMSGTLANCFKGPLAAQLRIDSPLLDAEEVMNCVRELRKLKKSLEQDDEEDGGEKKDAFDYGNVSVDADVDIDRFSYRSLALSDLEARSRLSGRNLVLESLRGVMGDGTFSASGSVGMEGKEGLDCACRITGTRLQLAQVMQSIAPERKEEVSGIADLAFNMQGRGATSDAFQKNLTGEGNFTVRDGKVSNLQFLQSLANFIKIDALKTLSFDESRGTFTISDGAIRLDSSLKGKDVELYPVGTIGLDSALDIALDMRLAPQLSDQIADGVLTRYFQDDKGWTLLSLAIKAPPGGEAVILPASSTIKNLSDMLVDILIKKEGAPADERQDKKKALEDLLHKLMQKSKNAGAQDGLPPQSE